MKFKAGDKVKCISLEGFKVDTPNCISWDKINIGDELVIRTVVESYSKTGLTGLEFVGKILTHPATSFELIGEDFKVGDRIDIPAGTPYSVVFRPLTEGILINGRKNMTIFKIENDYIYWEAPSYRGKNYFISKKEYLKKDTMNNKEIIGYKLKDKKYLDAARRLLIDEIRNYDGFELGIYSNIFSIDILKAADVLDLWFVPHYKNDKKQIDGVGSKNVTLVLEEDGNTISIVGKSEKLSLKLIKDFYEIVSKPTALGAVNIEHVEQSMAMYRVGCEKEDNRVSLNDIQRVIKAFS